jgi:hypothetical protein
VGIWVDADACPGDIKSVLFKAADRTGTSLTLVANHRNPVPPSRHIRFVQVASGFDVADHAIVTRMEAGDLVITGDIPLAAEILEKGGHAISPRGEAFDAETIRQRLGMRDMMEELRSSGVQTGGPAAPGPKERQAFANALDRWLTRHGG